MRFRAKIVPCGVVKEALACHRKALAAFRRFRSKTMAFVLVACCAAGRQACARRGQAHRASLHEVALHPHPEERTEERTKKPSGTRVIRQTPRKGLGACCRPAPEDHGESGRAQALSDLAGRARGLSALLVRSLPWSGQAPAISTISSQRTSGQGLLIERTPPLNRPACVWWCGE